MNITIINFLVVIRARNYCQKYVLLLYSVKRCRAFLLGLSHHQLFIAL